MISMHFSQKRPANMFIRHNLGDLLAFYAPSKYKDDAKAEGDLCVAGCRLPRMLARSACIRRQLRTLACCIGEVAFDLLSFQTPRGGTCSLPTPIDEGFSIRAGEWSSRTVTAKRD